MKMRIMFVDDDKFLLAGLRRLLRSCRDEWDMVFCESGADAIKCMTEHPADVVVSDMRMPGMDGAQLLSKIQAEFPNTVRLILSGQSEQESVFRILGPAHQYLSKPCEVTQLKHAIKRAYAIGQHLTRESVIDFVESIDSWPTMPTEITALIEQLQRSSCSAEDINDKIANCELCALLIQLVQSHELCQGRELNNLGQIIDALGADQLKPLVIAAGVFSNLRPTADEESKSFDQLLEHSVAVAATARRIVITQLNQQEMADQAFTAGLLHDAGKALLARFIPEKYQRTIVNAQQQNQPLVKAEISELGITHTDVGGYLLEQWGLPAPVIEAVTFHHEPSLAANAEMSPLTAVHVANAWINQNSAGLTWHGSENIDTDYLESIDLADALNRWQSAIQQPVNV